MVNPCDRVTGLRHAKREFPCKFARCDVRFWARFSLACGAVADSHSPPPAPATPPPAPQAVPDEVDPADDAIPAPKARSAEVLAKLMPSNATGCAPGARCIRVTGSTGRPQAAGAVHRPVSRRVRRLRGPAHHDPGELQRSMVPAEPDRAGAHRRALRHAAVAQLRPARREPAPGLSSGVAELCVCQCASPQPHTAADRRQ